MFYVSASYYYIEYINYFLSYKIHITVYSSHIQHVVCLDYKHLWKFGYNLLALNFWAAGRWEFYF
jgi:hypothetical protein